MSARLIVNPVAGVNSAPDYLTDINEALRSTFGDMDIVMTVAAGDAARAAQAAVEDGREYIFVGGGDGTLNEVLNGAADAPAGLGGVTFGLLPLGTGNDFAQALGIPEDVDAALEVLRAGRTLQVDVGALNRRCFVNVSAGGFIAEVSDATNPQLKTIAGKLAYLIGGAQVLLDYSPVPARVRAVTGNGQPLDRTIDLQMFAVCNSRLVGGGRMIAPHAYINDGWLDVCLVEAIPTLEFCALLARVPTGEHLDHPNVSYFRASELTLEFERTLKVNTDGEVLEGTRCDYRLFPRAAKFLAGEAPFAQ